MQRDFNLGSPILSWAYTAICEHQPCSDGIKLSPPLYISEPLAQMAGGFVHAPGQPTRAANMVERAVWVGPRQKVGP